MKLSVTVVCGYLYMVPVLKYLYFTWTICHVPNVIRLSQCCVYAVKRFTWSHSTTNKFDEQGVLIYFGERKVWELGKGGIKCGSWGRGGKSGENLCDVVKSWKSPFRESCFQNFPKKNTSGFHSKLDRSSPEIARLRKGKIQFPRV